MNDRDDIIDTITRLFWHVDHHDWDDAVRSFDELVTLDYTSLQGGDPATLAATDIVAGWRTVFEAIDAHQHLLANHLVTVDGGTAVATAGFIASHQFGGDTWTLGGDYRFELRRTGDAWRITAMTMTAGWQTGDASLMERATNA